MIFLGHEIHYLYPKLSTVIKHTVFEFGIFVQIIPLLINLVSKIVIRRKAIEEEVF